MSGLTDSIRDRLRNLANQRGEDFQAMLVQYGLVRLLYRLSVSPVAGRFLLEGAMLFQLWGSDVRRPTRDLDLLGEDEPNPEQLASDFRTLAAMEIDDGLSFDPRAIVAEPIRKDARYGGIRVRLMAKLANIRIPIQVDVGFGDSVFPAPERRDFPVLLEGMPSPRISAYPAYRGGGEVRGVGHFGHEQQPDGGFPRSVGSARCGKARCRDPPGSYRADIQTTWNDHPGFTTCWTWRRFIALKAVPMRGLPPSRKTWSCATRS